MGAGARGGAVAFTLPETSPELARPPPAETGLRGFLALAGSLRQLTRRRRPGPGRPLCPLNRRWLAVPGGPRSAGRDVAQLAVEIIRVWDRGAMLHGHAAKYAWRYRTNEPDDAGRQVRRAALSGLCREALRSALS